MELKFHELMSGTYTLCENPEEERPFFFEVDAVAHPAINPLKEWKAEISGDVTMADIADKRPFCAYESLFIFLRKTIELEDGIPGVVIAIQTFGDRADRFHPHLHTIISDGLFAKTQRNLVFP